MMRPDAKVEKVYLYPKLVDFRKSIDGLAALVELDIRVAVFDPVLFVFLNWARNRMGILYWERNGFCLWLKRLVAERFKAPPEPGDAAIVLSTTAQYPEHRLDKAATAEGTGQPNALRGAQQALDTGSVGITQALTASVRHGKNHTFPWVTIWRTLRSERPVP